MYDTSKHDTENMSRNCTSSSGCAHARGRTCAALYAIQPVYAAKTIVRMSVRSYLQTESATGEEEI